MTFPQYLSDYWYPNNFAEPILLMPVVYGYSILVVGAFMLFLAYLMYLLGKFRNLISYMHVIGLSLFLIVLLGPLADLRAPDNASRMMTSPRIMPTDLNPGFSIIAFQGAVAWGLGVIISIIFALLYFSYPLHIKYGQSKNPVLRGVYRALSLGVSTEKTYQSLQNPLKILAVVGILILSTWTVYPATLFIETYNLIWQKTSMLPIIFFIEYMVLGFGLLTIALWVSENVKLRQETMRPIMMVTAFALVSLIGVLALQLFEWSLKFKGSPVYPMFQHLYGYIGVAMGLFLVALIISIASNRLPHLSLIAALLGILGVFVNRWNFVMKAQEVSYTGLGVAAPHLHLIEYAITGGLFALGLFITLVLTSLFPIGFEFKRGEGI